MEFDKASRGLMDVTAGVSAEMGAEGTNNGRTRLPP